jgi:hypothetical protein
MRGEAGAFFGLAPAFGGFERLSRRIHDLAFFWKVAPQVVWNTPVTDLVEWFRHGARIEKELAKENARLLQSLG